MFETLMAEVRRKQAEFEFELARTNDPYRLKHLLSAHMAQLDMAHDDACTMVAELEEE